MQDGGGRHLENLQNRNISAMERPILMKFGTNMRLGPSNTVSQENFVNSTIQHGGGRHLDNRQNLNIFATD